MVNLCFLWEKARGHGPLCVAAIGQHISRGCMGVLPTRWTLFKKFLSSLSLSFTIFRIWIRIFILPWYWNTWRMCIWCPSVDTHPLKICNKYFSLNFPGSVMVKNLPSNAGDTDSIPCWEISHKQQGNQTHAPQLRPNPAKKKKKIKKNKEIKRDVNTI